MAGASASPHYIAPVAAPQARSDVDKYLVVALGEEQFALPVGRVKEIVECHQITPLPAAPSSVRGAIDLRGHILPVVDLALQFGSGRVTLGKRTCVVVADIRDVDEPFDVGLLVDAVLEVADIPAASIEAAPSLNGAIKTHYTRGVGKVRDRFVILLNVETIVSRAELAGLADTTVAQARV